MANKSFEISETRDYDVVVVGGGTTGIAAAIAAARCGSRTALIEYHGFLGGNSAAIPAWIGFHDLAGRRVIGGICHEMIERLRTQGAATPYYLDPVCSSFAGVEAHWWKITCVEAVLEAGVHVLLHALAVDVDLEPGGRRPRLAGVYVQTRGGLILYRARAFVDATDAGDLALQSGVRMIRGREGDHQVQVASWTVTFSEIDFDAVFSHFRAVPTDIRPWPLEALGDVSALIDRMQRQDAFVMGSFRSLVASAIADGLALPRDNVPGIAFPRLGEIRSVAVRVKDVNPKDPDNFTRSEMEGMRQVRSWYRFLRDYVPGCGRCRLTDSPATIGIRETNHMVGEYVLRAEDLLAARRFDDVIALGGYHIDIHTPDNPGSGELYKTPCYQIPYRSLLPREVDGLLVAGRAISAEHRALASTRVIPISMAEGEAAGVASALAAVSGKAARDVDVPRVQQTLLDRGGILKQ